MFPRQSAALSVEENTRQLNAVYLEMANLLGVAHREHPNTHIVIEAGFRFVAQRRGVMNAIFKTRGRCSVLLLTAQRVADWKRFEIRQMAGRSPCNVMGYEKVRAEFEAIRIAHRIIDNSGSIAELYASLDAYISENIL
jgi:hypothetical protein